MRCCDDDRAGRGVSGDETGAPGRDRRPVVPLADSLGAVVRGLRDEPARPGSRPIPGGTTPDGAPEATVAAMGGVFGRWEEAVGAAVAAHVQPVKLQGATLVVEVDDPSWATQLRFLEATLRERLAEVAGAVIDTVEVRVRRR